MLLKIKSYCLDSSVDNTIYLKSFVKHIVEDQFYKFNFNWIVAKLEDLTHLWSYLIQSPINRVLAL